MFHGLFSKDPHYGRRFNDFDGHKTIDLGFYSYKDR